MRRPWILASFVVVLLAAATALYAYGFINDWHYYSDGTYTTEVGYWYRNCDGTVLLQGGVTSDYRKKFDTSCRTGYESTICDEFINGTWVVIECPN